MRRMVHKVHKVVHKVTVPCKVYYGRYARFVLQASLADSVLIETSWFLFHPAMFLGFTLILIVAGGGLWRYCWGYHREGEEVKVLNMSRNFGVTPCVLAGLEHAKGDLVIYWDADLQDPPEVIPQMIQSWREDAQVAVVHTIRSSRAGEARLKYRVSKYRPNYIMESRIGFEEDAPGREHQNG